MGIYPEDKDQVVRKDSAVTQYQRVNDKQVPLKPDLPGTIILIHGVNDVGVSYGGIEQGLCQGLSERLGQSFVPGTVKVPQDEDKDKLPDDPDAVFFKRTVTAETHSPVIPFYWGFREVEGKYKRGEVSRHGQALDRFGNRLDKDFSKGGGPFANATSTLADMWRFGFNAGPGDATDLASGDAMRPVLKAPGRMYMVLAAKRMAALIAMIRDWDAHETVSIVAHSQGCMVSLLTQAFLLEQGLQPVDTLVITHPPYSLVDDIPLLNDMVGAMAGGEDELMSGKYDCLRGMQSLHARLQTLVNIVKGVSEKKQTTPAFDTLKNPEHRGVVGARWEPSKDRDNRGKVYLYFCPEDRTVALNNVQGIGWQGVPDYMQPIHGEVAYEKTRSNASSTYRQRQIQAQEREQAEITRQPLRELGSGFFQRVFTAKKRPGPVLIGQAQPHDFILRQDGEDDNAHAAPGAGTLRKDSIPVDAYRSLDDSPYGRMGVRTINGEPLPKPVKASMYEGSASHDGPKGAYEEVDPIDAAIATTSRFGYRSIWVKMADPSPRKASVGPGAISSPSQRLHPHKVRQDTNRIEEVQAALNSGKTQRADETRVLDVYYCLGVDMHPTGQLLVHREESPNEARLRWQHELSPRSFHGAIFGGAENHRQVTAYDVAIGQGKAPSDLEFYAYLCAVADWRLKKLQVKNDRLRPGILEWGKFQVKFGKYYSVEPAWRKAIIEGNSDYYSTGILPKFLPVLPEGAPPAVVVELVMPQRKKRPAPHFQGNENPGATTPTALDWRRKEGQP